MEFTPWPGSDGPPVVLAAGRPRPNRPRLATDWGGPSPRYYTGPNGELLVPAKTKHHRASSTSAARPAQIIINNDNINEDWEQRPGSGAGLVVVDGANYRARSHSRSHSPYYEDDYSMRKKLDRLKELERREEKEELEKKLKDKMLLEKAKEDEEERERKKEEKELKKKAVEEWKEEERKKKEKEKDEKEKLDKEFEERTRNMLWRNGYTEAQIERMIKKEKKGKESESKETRVIALNRPTFIRVKHKHLDPDTLDLYELPWEWDEADSSYIIIKQWVPERQQEILFEHTRKLREAKQLTYTTTELRKQRDQLLLVKKKHDRKKSPGRSWFTT